MSRLLFPFLLALLIASCGGGDSGGGDREQGAGKPGKSILIHGRVIDGYVNGATVFADLNANNQLDADEPRTLSDAQGRYRLYLQAVPPGKSVDVLAWGGIDTLFNTPLYGILKNTHSASDWQNEIGLNLSPLSTLAVAYQKSSPHKVTMAEAIDFVHEFAAAHNLQEDSVQKFAEDPNDLKQNIKLHRLVLSLTKLSYQNLRKENVYRVYNRLVETVRNGTKLNDIETIQQDGKTIHLRKLVGAIYQEVDDIHTVDTVIESRIFNEALKNPAKHITIEDSNGNQPAEPNPNPPSTPPTTPTSPTTPPTPPAINHIPKAMDVSLSTDEDSAVSGSLDASDADGDSLSYAKLSDPAHGSLTAFDTANGTFTYQPNANWHGSDSFTYQANDSKADSNTATVTITVNAVNDAPTANDFAIGSVGGSARTVDWQTLSAADDVEDDVADLTAAEHDTDTASKGTVTISGKDLTYTPKPNQNGTDSFKLNIQDSEGATVTVTVTVSGIDTVKPTMTTGSSSPLDGAASFNKDSPLVYRFDKAIDLGSASISLKQGTTSVTINAALEDAGQTLKITHGGLAYGTEYTLTLAGITDQNSNAFATQTITFTTAPKPNTAPVASNVSLTTDEDNAVSGSLDASDADGDSVSYVKLSDPSHGSLTAFDTANGTFTYQPNANWHGSDSFTYQANDSKADSNTATVTITVNAVNDSFSIQSITNWPAPTFEKTALDENFTGAYKTYSSLVADFDADGQDEALVFYYGSNKIYWYDYDEASKKLVKKGETNLNSPTKGQVVDLNRDGKPDFIVATGVDNHFYYYEYTGSGTFPFKVAKQIDSSSWARDIAAANLDDDANLEVVTLSSGDDKLKWYAFDGSDFSLKGEITNAVNNFDFCLMDVDNDGKKDIIVGNTNNLHWYQNQGDATLAASSFALQANPLTNETLNDEITLITCEDIDNDGKKDILVSRRASIQLYKNNGDASFSPITAYQTADDNITKNTTFADLTGNGLQDLVFIDGQALYWLENENGSFTFANKKTLASTPGLSGYAMLNAGDFNGNGLSSVLYTPLQTSGDTRVWLLKQSLPHIAFDQAKHATDAITTLQIKDVDNDVTISTNQPGISISQTRSGNITTAALRFAALPAVADLDLQITLQDSATVIKKSATLRVYQTQPLAITAASPHQDSSNLAIDGSLAYTFNQAVDTSAATITLQQGATNIALSHALSNADRRLTIQPDSDLEHNTRYTLTLSGLKDLGGTVLDTQTITFTTRAQLYFAAPGGSGNGSSWANADSVQDAINAVAAKADKAKYQIWLKSGTYSGATVHLQDGVALYGGFAGTESELDQRDFTTNQTIFDGQNARRVFSANSVNNVILDGIIIQNANLSTHGAGLYMNHSSLEINNTIFQNNNTTGSAYGAGIYAAGSGKLKVSNSSFINNKAQDGSAIISYIDLEIYDSNFTQNINRAGSGGAIANVQANLIVKNSNFIQNEASTQLGGAIYTVGATGKTTLIEDSNFTENKAVNGGAVISNDGNLTIKNSNFIKNNATYGAAITNKKGNNLIENSTFKENNATNGAIYNETSKTKIVSSYFYKNEGVRGGALASRYSDETQIHDSNFTQNTASHGGAFEIRYSSKVTVVSSNFIENNAYYGGAIKVDGGELKAKNSNFTKNEANLGGAIYLNPDATSEIENAKFIQNTATGNSGGAIYHNANNELKVYSSTFYQNTSDNTGGAIHTNNDKKSLIVNSTFTANETQNVGGALYVSARGTINTVHSTFVANQSKHGGADIAKAGNATSNIINSILWRDDSKNHLYGSSIIKKSIIKNGVGASADVIKTNPQLQAHTADGVPLYYTLGNSSPAINGGVTSSGISGVNIPATDQRGQPRNDGQPDIGAVEM